MTDNNLPTSVLARLLFGGIFAAPGILIMAVGTKTLEVDPSTVHAPYWLLTMIGGMFAIAGLWIISAGTPAERFMKVIVGPAVLIGIVTALEWVAFGPGVRQCTGSLSIPFVSFATIQSDMQCRIGFGFAAIIFDGLFLGAGITQLAKKMDDGAGKLWTGRVGNAAFVIGLLPLVPLILLALGMQWVGRVYKKAVGRAE